MKTHILILAANGLICATSVGQVITPGVEASAPKPVPSVAPVAPTNPNESLRSLGVFVTKARISKLTPTGFHAIPVGTVVAVVEDPTGQKFAVFRQARIPIQDLSQLTDDPTKIAAAAMSGSTLTRGNQNPGTALRDGSTMAPETQSNEQIRLDDKGNIISRSKTTTISDGAGNTTTITQGRSGGMSPEQAGRLEAAKLRIEQQRSAIHALQARRSEKKTMTGYEAKMKEMTEQLARMEIALAQMRVEINN
jgi:hypothetical protein